VTITSEPALGEIEIDGKFMGNTRSALRLAPGTHQITVKKSGYASWTKTVEVTAGSEMTVHADLVRTKEPTPTQKSAPAKK
jgi:PEGA domain.